MPSDNSGSRAAFASGILPRAYYAAARHREQRDRDMYELHAEAIIAGISPVDAQAAAERMARTTHRSILHSIATVRQIIKTEGALRDA